MAIFIDVITGFLESGKTSFVKEQMKGEDFEVYESPLLIVCEEGLEEYNEEELANKNVNIVFLERESELADGGIQQIINKATPDYILIEYNGTWDITKLFSLKLPDKFRLRNVVFISEAIKFNHYLSNMALLMQPHVLNSDLVIFNRYETLENSKRKKLCCSIKNMNAKTEVFFLEELGTRKKISNYFIPFKKAGRMSISTKIIIFLLIGLSITPASIFQNNYSNLQSISTVFLGILMQAVPFLLLGTFISSIIQTFVSPGWIIRKFSKNNVWSFLLAATAGFFVPVCDCGMVPIVSGLLKKETPLPQVITFWLASSAVNPIVLLSVYYAFPEQPSLILIRLIAGVMIGIIVGIILKIAKIETKDVLKKNSRFQYIGSNLIDLTNKNKFGKVDAVFQGSKFEFFRVAKYLIVGALVSSFLQSVMPNTMKNFIGGNIATQFLIMIVAAILMSTCSTSNAFIGRSFYANLSIIPIMSFITMGPMLDFKNMIMLSEVLKKGFLIKLAGLVIATGAVVFSILAVYL